MDYLDSSSQVKGEFVFDGLWFTDVVSGTVVRIVGEEHLGLGRVQCELQGFGDVAVQAGFRGFVHAICGDAYGESFRAPLPDVSVEDTFSLLGIRARD